MSDQAWQRLVHVLERMSGARTGESFQDQDRALAAEVAAAPGRLESQLLSEADDLAARRCSDSSFPSLLGYFWNLCPPGDPALTRYPEIFRGLPATFAAMDAAKMLGAYAAARQRSSRMGAIAQQNSVRIARYFLQRAGLDVVDTLGLPGEHRDVLRGPPLPDVLPVDLTAWSPERIAGTLAEYAGMSVAALEARLGPGGCSSSGFLAPGESLGEVIHRDAVVLAQLGVPRHAVAERIDAALDGHWHAWFVADPSMKGNAELREQQRRREDRLRAWLGNPSHAGGTFDLPFACKVTVFAGHQEDPFHSIDTYGMHGDPRGACDFAISNPARGAGAVLRGPDLIAVLIRRYGFFEGAVGYRVDPARAAWVLGLTGA